jgi:hypothetical protein
MDERGHTIMRLLSTVAGAAGILMVAGGSPANAAGPPVSVVECIYRNLLAGGSLPANPRTAPIEISDLLITFVNQAPRAAKKVRFTVRYDDGTQQVVDAAGTFSTGTPITREFTPSTDPYYNGSAACSVQSVTFSDGSTWQSN